MAEPERRRRMRALRAQVLDHDVHRWVASFLDALDETPAHADGRSALGATPEQAVQQ